MMATETNGWTSVQCKTGDGEFEAGVTTNGEIMVSAFNHLGMNVSAELTPEDTREFGEALVRYADLVDAGGRPRSETKEGR